MKIIVTFFLLAAMTSTASAGCRFGEKNLPGSLGAGQRDNSRSYTVDDNARFSLDVVTGGPISANIGCGWNTAYSHSCQVFAWGDTRVKLHNRTGGQITYRWICEH